MRDRKGKKTVKSVQNLSSGFLEKTKWEGN